MTEISSKAIVLYTTNYGESDRIVTFLTPGYGRLKGFARSARKSKKRFGAALEPFTEVQMHWRQRPTSELVSLTNTELISLHSGIRRDLETISLAGYGCELIDALFDESGVGVEVYHLLQAFLNHLDQHGYSLETRILMELRMLSLAGYVPHLQHCADCFGPLSAGPVGFSAAHNGSLCPECDGGRAILKVDRMTLGTLGRILETPLGSFAGFSLSSLSKQEAIVLLRNALNCHLQRPLKSLEMLNRFTSSV